MCQNSSNGPLKITYISFYTNLKNSKYQTLVNSVHAKVFGGSELVSASYFEINLKKDSWKQGGIGE